MVATTVFCVYTKCDDAGRDSVKRWSTRPRAFRHILHAALRPQFRSVWIFPGFWGKSPIGHGLLRVPIQQLLRCARLRPDGVSVRGELALHAEGAGPRVSKTPTNPKIVLNDRMSSQRPRIVSKAGNLIQLTHGTPLVGFAETWANCMSDLHDGSSARSEPFAPVR